MLRKNSNRREAGVSHATEKLKSDGDGGFTYYGKTQIGGRRGFQPPHNANQINEGFSPGETFFANFVRNSEFFCSLFSRAVIAAKSTRALAPEGMLPSQFDLFRGSLVW
jgi:hypothetical protein